MEPDLIRVLYVVASTTIATPASHPSQKFMV
jgi:hypothetical protein